MTAILLCLLALVAFMALGWALTLNNAITKSRQATRATRDAYRQTRMTRNLAKVRL